MDKLEKYIKDNRADLDRHSPDPAIWQRIQVSKPGLGIQVRKIARWAAAVAILVSVSIVFGLRIDVGFGSFSGTDQGSNELLETEMYYSNKVNNLLIEARPFLLSNPVIGEDLMLEISDLDSLYTEIKRDLKDNVSNEDVIEALITNYRVKIEILEEMLDILKEEESTNNEKIDHEI